MAEQITTDVPALRSTKGAASTQPSPSGWVTETRNECGLKGCEEMLNRKETLAIIESL